MKGLAVIQVTRAIRRLASAITPGTSPEVSDGMLGEAAALIAEAMAMGGVISRPEPTRVQFRNETLAEQRQLAVEAESADVPIMRVKDLDVAIARYCEALTRAGRCADSEGIRHEPDPRGKKYTRIVRITTSKTSGEVTSRSVHAFVKREDGTIWKAAGWKAPALNFPRGSVFEPDGYASHLHGYGL